MGNEWRLRGATRRDAPRQLADVKWPHNKCIRKLKTQGAARARAYTIIIAYRVATSLQRALTLPDDLS